VRSRLALAGATSIGEEIRIFGWPRVACEGELLVGRGVVFVSSPAPIQLMVAHGGALTIGDGSLIESGVTLRARRRIVIGKSARLGVGCILDDDGADDGEIVVKDHAWIEDGAILLGGARVEAGVVVSRGTVVGGQGNATHDVPAGAPPEPSAGVVEKRLREVVSRIVPSVARAAGDADLRAFRGWDSLAALRVLVALEKEFGVVLPHDLFTQRPQLASAIAAISADRGAWA
jgi:acetyltransferase-like isoleucine patch superfamily enzyme/acyl carrier protein